MLFLHVIPGCYTTFCIYSIGKGTILKKFKDNVALQQPALIFENSHMIPAQIDHTEESVLVIIYNGKNGDTLNALRLHPIATKKPLLKQIFWKLSDAISPLTALVHIAAVKSICSMACELCQELHAWMQLLLWTKLIGNGTLMMTDLKNSSVFMHLLCLEPLLYRNYYTIVTSILLSLKFIFLMILWVYKPATI